MIKGIIFDVRGVIVFNIDPHVFEDISKTFGVSIKKAHQALPVPLEKLEKGEVSTEEFLKDYAKQLNKPIPDVKRLLTRSFEKNFAVDEKVIDLIKKLKSKGYVISALSNTHKDDAEVYKINKVYDIFDHVVLSCEVGLVKPDPKIYELCAKKMGLSPEECVFIDDSSKNLPSAKELGMKIILFENVNQLNLELTKLEIDLK